jgi:hypothetical protein
VYDDEHPGGAVPDLVVRLQRTADPDVVDGDQAPVDGHGVADAAADELVVRAGGFAEPEPGGRQRDAGQRDDDRGQPTAA